MRKGILIVGLSLLVQIMAVVLALPSFNMAEWQTICIMLIGFALYVNGAFIVVDKA